MSSDFLKSIIMFVCLCVRERVREGEKERDGKLER